MVDALAVHKTKTPLAMCVSAVTTVSLLKRRGRGKEK